MRKLAQALLRYRSRFGASAATPEEPRVLVEGWEQYAKAWAPDQFRVVPGARLDYLGDEWTAEDVSDGTTTTYGLLADDVQAFNAYIEQHLLDPYLPKSAAEGLEIGPGGGRITTLLAPRTRLLHVADPSQSMLKHLHRRFEGIDHLRYYKTDGITLPPLRPASLDYVLAFDVFVHFEARLVYWYLRQIASVLKPGGIGIIHYANVLTPLGWRNFAMEVEANLTRRTSCGTFGVLCPQLMGQFLEVLGYEVISTDIRAIPRDAVAVFRRLHEPHSEGGAR